MTNQAIILAAGLGSRLRPITAMCPKPLLTIAGKPLIVYHLEALEQAGVINIVIHVSYLAEMIIDTIGDGKNWGLTLNIAYAISDQPLESGGGIRYSLPYLVSKTVPFICVNSDILTDYDYYNLVNLDLKLNLGHFVLVANPVENPNGDYDIIYNNNVGSLTKDFNKLGLASYKYTYTGIALYNTSLLEYYLDLEPDHKFSIIKIIKQHLDLMTASVHTGMWHDIGSVDRYYNLR